MIDGNISMEEDTELKDLVVQALENNGVLAKVRAELRASVFLALEEQESVENPEPLLNKTVKQYLSNSEGKLLFSLVREFLEYFGLDYTISVYDPETYIGQEWNYMGRKKLSEKLGIRTTEPLLGELLKNSLNGAFNNSQQSDANDSRLNKTNETSAVNNATFEVSVPKLINQESSLSIDNDSSQRDDTVSSEISQEIPINVTITDKKQADKKIPSNNALIDTSSCEIRNDDLSKIDESDETGNNNTKISDDDDDDDNGDDTNDNATNLLSHNKSEQLIKFDDTIETNCNEKGKMTNNVDLQNNAQNRRITGVDNNFGKTVYFEEIIVDGKKEKVDGNKRTESLLGDLPPIAAKGNSIFGDLPPLNGKKTNINDLKELMDIGLTSDNDHHYEEDFASSASGSANEASPAKNPEPESPLKQHQKDDKINNSARSEEISEEIDEVLSANVSCVSDPIVI